jgi:hypothetical protein
MITPLATEWGEPAAGTPAATTPAQAMPPPEVYFEPAGQRYFRKDSDGHFIAASSAGVRRLLKGHGYASKAAPGESLSALDAALELIETRQNVSYAAPLAGHAAGMHLYHGRKILVTQSPKLIEPQAGRWDTLQVILEGLLGDDQLAILCGWLQVAIGALRRGVHRPGQCLAIAGPPRCGKSLLQALITELLGGRSGKPYGFMTGTTDFNSELFAAEHLMIEDEAASSDPRVRKSFGAMLKAFAVNRDHRCHAKNREALMLCPLWRLSITLNDDAPSLLVLPQLDEGIADKITLLHASPLERWPIDTAHPGGEELLWRTLMEELPAFVAFLDDFQIPPTLREPRFGIATFHNPTLLGLMDSATDEMRLLDLIDGHLFANAADPEAPWRGRAAELEELLVARCGQPAKRLFFSNSACGSLLGQLARKHPGRVRNLSTVQGHTRWQIMPPPAELIADDC